MIHDLKFVQRANSKGINPRTKIIKRDRQIKITASTNKELMWKLEAKKIMEREENSTIKMLITDGLLKCTRVSGFRLWSPSSLGGICYLYKLRQTDKTRESCPVWTLKILILMVIGLNIPIWIEIGESPTLSSSLHLTVDKDELLPRGNNPIWIRIGL